MISPHEQLRRDLCRAIRNSGIDSQLAASLEGQVRAAVAKISTNPDEGIALLRAAAGRMPSHKRTEFLAAMPSAQVTPQPTAASASSAPIASANGVDVVIVCALHDPEYKELMALFDSPEIVKIDSDGELAPETYALVEITDDSGVRRRIVTCFQTHMGMVDCAILCTKVLRRWKPSYLAMCGVCGGRKKAKVAIGDVIIGTETFTYMSGKLSDAGFEVDPVHESAPADTKEHLIAHAERAFEEACTASSRLTSKGNVARVGTIACGDIVVDKRGAFEEQIAKLKRSVLGVDMESHALFRTASLLGAKARPFVVKTVMDLTEGKTDAAKADAAHASAATLIQLIKNLPF